MKKKIIVVGAGLAGLAAAYELAKTEKYDLVVLEAEDYVGGRVQSVEIENHKVDLGGFIIFPWYKNYMRLIDELGVSKLLFPISNISIYYQMELNGEYYLENKIPIPIREKLKLALNLLSKFFRNRSNPVEPNLNLFERENAHKYFQSVLGKDSYLEKYLDVLLQGYCYPAATEYRMSFLAPIIFNSYIKGDVQKSSYFRGNSQLFTEKLADKIRDFGGKILLNTKVTGFSDGVIHTEKEDFSADKIVFAQNVDKKLFSEVVDFDVKCDYTKYYSLIVKLKEETEINGDKNWASIFNAPNDSEMQFISGINLASISEHFSSKYLCVYVVSRDEKKKEMSDAEVLGFLNKDLEKIFEGNSVEKVYVCKRWKAMPVTEENFVQSVRKSQGKNGFYFAGDYLGAPSMETALGTGIQVAKEIISG